MGYVLQRLMGWCDEFDQCTHENKKVQVKSLLFIFLLLEFTHLSFSFPKETKQNINRFIPKLLR